jgi:hypothetical protein
MRTYRGEPCSTPDPEARPYRTEPDGLATIEIAKRLGITNRQVQRTLKTAIAKMRDLLEAETITEEP